MKKVIGLLIMAALLTMFTASSHAYNVFAQANSSSGGVGVPTISLTAGQAFAVTVDPKDLWNAGPLPRWSNADGLVGNLYATGTDDSGQPAGTQIGQNFGLWSQNGLSAPYGSLVGQIASLGVYFLIGTNYSGVASSGGTLNLYYWDSNNSDNTQQIFANVNIVPIPAAAWLLGTGLFGLVLIRRRMKK